MKIKSIKLVDKATEVHDLQTDTENFFAAGVLVHNCFTEAILTEPYGAYCSVGCNFCLPAGELVSTPDGRRAVESLAVGDVVYGRAPGGKVPTTVTGTASHVTGAGLVRIYLSDGRRLLMTPDHPVYSTTRGWTPAGELYEGEGMEDEVVQLVPCGEGEEYSQVLPSVLATLQSCSQEALPGLQTLSTTHPQEESGSVRCLHTEGEVGCCKGHKGSQGRRTEAEVCRDESEDVGLGVGTSGGYGPPRQRAEVGGLPPGQGRGCAHGGVGIQVVPQARFYGPQGPCLPYAFGMGGSGSPVPGRPGLGLGLRALLHSITRRLGLLAGFRARVWDYHRGQGLLPTSGQGEDKASGRTRLLHQGLRQGAHGVPGYPHVTRVQRLPGRLRVYDIETGTGNFYQRGVLVHNCYVNNGTRGYRGTGLMSVPMHYHEQVARQLSQIRRAAAGYFSSFTDPFVSLERYYHNSEKAAGEFVKAGLPIFFLSRLLYPDWAVKLLTRNPHSYAQKSLNTSDQKDWHRLSPGADTIADHLADITRLKAAGIYVSIQVNPIVPGVTSNHQVLKLFKLLRDAGADHVIVKFVEANHGWARLLVERMVRLFGDRGREFGALFTDNQGGERVVEEGYRLTAHRLFSNYARELGLTYATCYEYRYKRDVAGNITSKAGISIGREFATSDQCHGHRVPVYVRDSDDDLFRPLEECPPSGCLYCAEENEEAPGKARCGDEMAGKALALKLKDMRLPLGVVNSKLGSLELPVVSNDEGTEGGCCE